MRSGTEVAAAYRMVHMRVDKLLRGRAELCDVTVPACPQWSIRQTVSHLAGTAQDIASFNLDGVGTDEWTHAQLARLADRSLEELLDLWVETIDTVDDLLTEGPKLAGAQAVFDALTHEHDICGAMAEPGPRVMDPVFEVAAGFLATVLDRAIRRTSAPAVRLTTPTAGTLQLGDPTTAPDRIAVNLSDFEMLRAFGGRRSVRQILALPWQGEPADLLSAFSTAVVRPPPTDLIE